MMVAPVLAPVSEAQNKSRLREKDNKQGYQLERGLYLRHIERIRNKPPPQSGPCLLLRRGAYFREVTQASH